MPFAIDVPDGHGHRYTQASIDHSAAILQLPSWSDEVAERLRSRIGKWRA